MRLSWASLNLFMKWMRKNWWWGSKTLFNRPSILKICWNQSESHYNWRFLKTNTAVVFPVLMKCFIISVSLFLHALESTLCLAESQGFSNPSVIVARLKFLRCQEYFFVLDVFNKPVVVWNQQPMMKPTVSLTVFHSIFVLFLLFCKLISTAIVGAHCFWFLKRIFLLNWWLFEGRCFEIFHIKGFFNLKTFLVSLQWIYSWWFTLKWTRSESHLL